MAASPEPVAVGELPGGGWIGLAAGPEYRVVVGPAPEQRVGLRPLPGDGRSALIALAIVYFEEALPAPPDGVEEATHGEMAALVAWLARTAADDAEAREAQLALDAIEDGLPGDAVALRLMQVLALLGAGEAAAGGAVAGEAARGAPLEAVDLLLARVRAATG